MMSPRFDQMTEALLVAGWRAGWGSLRSAWRQPTPFRVGFYGSLLAMLLLADLGLALLGLVVLRLLSGRG